MKLSEAIRIGSSWSRQIKTMLKTSKGTCALGAAIEGAFGDVLVNNDITLSKPENFVKSKFWNDSELFRLQRTFSYLEEYVVCPELNQMMRLESVIWRLNDRYNWTREQIADWVEKLEIENGWEGTKDIKEKVNALYQTK